MPPLSSNGVRLNRLRVFILAIGGAGTLWLLLLGVTWPPTMMFHGPLWIVVWVSCPYALLAIGMFSEAPRLSEGILAGASAVITCFGLAVYLDAFLGDVAAQGPLVFLSIPAVQLIAAVAAQAAAWVVTFRHQRRIS